MAEKVKGHITDAHVASGEHSALDKEGNDGADAEAGAGIKLLRHYTFRWCAPTRSARAPPAPQTRRGYAGCALVALARHLLVLVPLHLVCCGL